MFTLVGWSEAQDSAVLVETAALADPHITAAGDVIRVPEFAPNLVGAIALGVNVSRAQLRSPSLRRICNLEVAPLNVGVEPLSPVVACLFPSSPIALDVDEDMTALMAEVGAGATRVTILAWLADGALAPVSGEIFSVQVTTTPAAAAYLWANSALAFDQQLPAGEYAIVGARMIGADLLAFRFVFPGGMSRPGGIGGDAVEDLPLNGQIKGGWGEWGRFRHTVPPTLDSLAVAGGVLITGSLDIVKVA